LNLKWSNASPDRRAEKPRRQRQSTEARVIFEMHRHRIYWQAPSPRKPGCRIGLDDIGRSASSAGSPQPRENVLAAGGISLEV
jgi:hypothetical protein